MFPLKDENPTFRKPYVTIALIIINVLVFLGPQSMNNPEDGGGNSFEWAAIPCEVVTGDGLTSTEIDIVFAGGDQNACDSDPNGAEQFPDKPVRIAMLFSMFMHGSLMHLGGNMLFLWIFGNNIEDHLGHVRYLLFYLAGGIVATIAHIAIAPDSIIPVVGASGAVAAIMGAYAVWFPNAPIRTIVMIMLMNIKAKWWLGFWLITQFFTGADSGVAWMAHVGGFVFGALIAWPIRGSIAAQYRAFVNEHRNPDPWDSTGGIGHGPYPHPQEVLQDRRHG